MRNLGAGPAKHNAELIDSENRERDFVRAVPQLRRFANRLLTDVIEVESVISEVLGVWIDTEGYFDAPIRHLLRLVAQGCIERQRAITRSMPEPTDEERAVLAIADIAEVSLLIAVNRLPRRAREAYVASVLGRTRDRAERRHGAGVRQGRDPRRPSIPERTDSLELRPRGPRR